VVEVEQVEADATNGRLRHYRDAGVQLKVVLQSILVGTLAEVAGQIPIRRENWVFIDIVVAFPKELG
jgi:hypothetical protein